ncbi:MAG: hydroxyacylglutathione hydrolase [Bdellovibrionales bacterium]|nr:hydroxyacylglutathione hydrolase [Bdellovibrionales bacterium]
MKVHLIPALSDNYIFLIEMDSSYICVDPAVSKPVIDFCGNKPLSQILITHHHHDHIGGIQELKNKYNCEVYAPEYDKHRIENVDHWVKDNDQVQINNLSFNVSYTPGHTLGHIVYYCPEMSSLFCGDTLFRLGCGRLFEGSYEQMYNSLEIIKELPKDTKIYCAHEYTETNLKFCHHHNLVSDALKNEEANILNLRQNNQPTVPTTLDIELETSPFLNPQKHYPDLSPEEGFKTIRELRNKW